MARRRNRINKRVKVGLAETRKRWTSNGGRTRFSRMQGGRRQQGKHGRWECDDRKQSRCWARGAETNKTRKDGNKYSTSAVTSEEQWGQPSASGHPVLEKGARRCGSKGQWRGRERNDKKTKGSKRSRGKRKRKRGQTNKRAGAERHGRIWHVVPCAK